MRPNLSGQISEGADQSQAPALPAGTLFTVRSTGHSTLRRPSQTSPVLFRVSGGPHRNGQNYQTLRSIKQCYGYAHEQIQKYQATVRWNCQKHGPHRGVLQQLQEYRAKSPRSPGPRELWVGRGPVFQRGSDCGMKLLPVGTLGSASRSELSSSSTDLHKMCTTNAKYRNHCSFP